MKLNNVKTIELGEAYQKVLYLYFSFPNSESGLNDLSADLKISKSTAKKVVNDLIKIGFLNRKIYGKTWRITCNQRHFYNLTRKTIFNLAMVYEAYESGLREDIRKVVKNPRVVMLFGSYRRGDDTEKSDIDIAVEILEDKELQIFELGKIAEFGYRENVPVNLHVFSRKKIDLNLFSNIANGFVLEGFLEVRP